MPPASSRGSRLRAFVVWVVVCAFVITVLYYFWNEGLPRLRQNEFSHLKPPSPPPSPPSSPPPSQQEVGSSVGDPGMPDSWAFDHKRDSKNYGLSEAQCLDAFPLLYEAVDHAVEHRRRVGNVTLQEIEEANSWNGTVRAMIRNNELYIISTHAVWMNENRLRSLATLNSLARTVSSYQGQLPDIEFALAIGDDRMYDLPFDSPIWMYSHLPNQYGMWLIPGHAFWAAPGFGLRSYSELRSLIVESEDDFLDKVPKLVWRGSVDETDYYDLRSDLLKASEGQGWSDVKKLDWHNEASVKEDFIPSEDLCAYMFVASAEDTNSGNHLKYLLNCNSIVMAHELRRVEHFHHLLAPSGDYQNYVQLKRDFSDLRGTMTNMLETETLENRGRNIADNARRMFRERYLTPAAEACYWRALIRGWASVQGFEPQMWTETEEPDWHPGSGGKKIKKKPRGVPFESYALMEDVVWGIPPKSRHMCIG